MWTYIDNVTKFLLFITTWICGVVLANGFWLTLLAALFPPYAWYLFAEKLLSIAGWI